LGNGTISNERRWSAVRHGSWLISVRRLLWSRDRRAAADEIARWLEAHERERAERLAEWERIKRLEELRAAHVRRQEAEAHRGQQQGDAAEFAWRYRPDRAERLDRVRRMLAAGSFVSAISELEDWRAGTTDASELAEINGLLDEVVRHHPPWQ
jgi:hypothetical protein